jgi:prepilin-type N-terminal cleavage/methylation domain-containing protein
VKRQHAPQRGFTLIELLVALTVSGMLLALLSQAFYLITRQWESRFSVQEQALDLAAREFLVYRALEGMVPFIAPQPNTNQQRFPLLNGSQRSLEWVTASPVWFSPPAVAELTLEEQSGNDPVHWVYRERAIGAIFSSGRGQAALEPESNRLVLWPYQGESLQYFGYLSLNARLGGVGVAMSGGPQWSNDYRGAVTGQIPMAVRLTADEGDLLSVDIPTNSLGYLQGGEF